ncbi:MAG: hypothetical protein ACFFDK_13205 [Promethearchaeota archaeon]
MVSTIGYLDGLTASGIILSSVIFGLLSFYRARKLEAKLLGIAGLMMILIGLLWLGPFTDFIMITITGKNIRPKQVYTWLSYMWVAPAIIIGMYLGSELLVPEYKKTIVIFYAILGVIFEIYLFFDWANVFTYTLNNPGQDTIDSSFNRTSPAYWIIIFFLISTFFFEGIGFAIKAKQASSEIRRKFTYLSVAFIVFVICGALDSVIPPGIAIGFSRAVMMSFSLWMYLGLKT